MYKHLAFSYSSLVDNLLVLYLKKYQKFQTPEQIQQRNIMKNVILGSSFIGHVSSALILGSRLSFLVGIPFNPIRDI